MKFRKVVIFFLIMFSGTYNIFSQVFLANDPNPGSCGAVVCSTWPREMTELNGAMFYKGRDHINNEPFELWRYDEVNEPFIVSNGLFESPSNLTVIDSLLYFNAKDNDGWDVWKYNGVDDPIQITNLNTTGGSGGFNYFTKYHDKIYFTAWGGNGSGLMTYDPVTGTVEDVFPVSTYISPSSLIVYHDTLYFSANDGMFGYELWQYSGSGNPTLRVDLDAGANSSNITPLIIFDDKLICSGRTTSTGHEIWTYEGTSIPSLIMDINQGIEDSNPSHPVIFNNKVYFSAATINDGVELWEYDGINIPDMIMDINSGSNSSFPDYFTIYNNVLYFSANDGVSGNELWMYDGLNPPELYEDIYAGPGESNPSDLMLFNDKLYFNALDTIVGLELHFISENASTNNYSSDKITVYPNPVKEALTISFGTLNSSSDFRITNLMGKVVLSSKVIQNTVDVSSLSSGVYLLEVDGSVLRFVKE
ncbi:MAG: T9SS type A sorting domain-containing protein [Crocinitomicaceae bacterium]